MSFVLLIQASIGSADETMCASWNVAGFFADATPTDVTRCLEAGVSVDAWDDSGWTPLHKAADSSDSSEIIEALVAAGADVHARVDTLGWTPLHVAAAGSDTPAIIEALVAAGADLHARTEFVGQTPLHSAAQSSGHPGIIEALVAAGADVHAQDHGGETSLHLAARSTGNPLIIEALLSAGANVNARDDAGATPLHATGRSDNPEIIEKLVAAGADVYARTDLIGDTPLHSAAQGSENPDVIAAFVAAGADVHARDALLGRTPLHLAAANGNPQIVETLITAGADLRARTKSGETPLHELARSSSARVAARILDTDVNDRGDVETLLNRVFDGEIPRIIDVLVAAGADVSTRSERGFTPLHMAAWFDATYFDKKHSWRWLGADVQALRETAQLVAAEIIRALVSAETDVDARDERGRTALHVAAMSSETPATIEALLEGGANVGTRDADGLTPLHAAAARSTAPRIIEVLVAAGTDLNARYGDGWTPIHVAAWSNDSPTIIKTLVAVGADVHAPDEAGRTPLYLAARYGDVPEVINALVAAGADIDARDEGNGSSLTPLHAAILHNDRPGIVEALVVAGADLVARYLGSTPLHLAAAKSAPTTIEALLEAGADPTSQDDTCRTPGDLAVSRDEVRSHPVFWHLNDARFQSSDCEPRERWPLACRRRRTVCSLAEPALPFIVSLPKPSFVGFQCHRLKVGVLDIALRFAQPSQSPRQIKPAPSLAGRVIRQRYRSAQQLYRLLIQSLLGRQIATVGTDRTSES